MKALKLILTNLILVFTLVILTGGIVCAAGELDVNVNVIRDASTKRPISYEIQLLKYGEVLSIDEYLNTNFTIKNSEYTGSSPISFYIYNRTLTRPLEDFIGDFPNWFEQTGNRAGTGDLAFDYDLNKKAIIVTPQTSGYIGTPLNSLDISVLERLPNGKEKTTTLRKECATSTNNIDFSIFYSFDTNIKYLLQIEGATFRELGNVGIYEDGELMQTTDYSFDYYFPLGSKAEPYLNLEMKNQVTGQTYGSVFIEDYESVVFEDTAQANERAEITVKTESGSEISFSELKKYGWKSLNLENKTKGEKYILNLNTLSFSLGNGQVSADGRKLILPTKGEYRIWVDNPYGGQAIEQKLTSIANSVFTATLERENLKYKLILDKTVEELKAYNGNKNYKIIIEDLNGSELASYDSYNKSFWFGIHLANNENVLIIEKDLYKYEKIKVRFASDKTGLNEELILDVPEIVGFENITAKILSPGLIGFFDTEGNSITTKEIGLALQVSEKTNLYLELCYDGGSENIEHSRVLLKEDIQWMLTRVNKLKVRVDNNDYDAITSEYYKVYMYYKDVVEQGKDLTLSLSWARQSDRDRNVMVPIEKPDITGTAYPYIEAITGLTIEEIREIVNKCDQLIEQNCEFVEGGLLTVSEATKDFKLSTSGVYYVHDLNDDNVFKIIKQSSINYYDKGLAYAGRLTGEFEDGKPLGEYICYDNDGAGYITYSQDYLHANCLPLLGNTVYRVVNESSKELLLEFIKLDVSTDTENGDLVEIEDETAQMLVQTQSGVGGNRNRGLTIGYILKEEKSFFSPLTEMISRFIMSLANGLNYLVQFSIRTISGETTATNVDIDKIIFNQFPDTSIAFFKSNTGGDNPSKLIRMFRDGISDWYGKFRAIAVAGYLVILLYIGVRILFSVGGKKQAQYKELLSHWLVGIVLLFFFPYVIRYAIDINNILVGMIAESKSGILNITDVNYEVDMSGFDLPSTSTNEDNVAVLQSQMDQIPFADEDTSYMAVMARRAEKSGKIVDAVVYLIMVWQFIMIVIMYYRRVFTVAFLIAIFPFVTLSYAIDKVADGKAQAFSTWAKEIMINIFVQSMHAIVYVFVIGATYTAGEYNGDWLLSIIGIMFLFQGEEILKKIIVQGGSTTTKSLTKTATRAILTIKATQKVTQSVSDNFIGSDSHLGRTIETYRKWKTAEKTARNMDFLGKPAYKPPTGKKLETYNSDAADASPDYDELADDIQVANNMNNINDPERIAKALQNIMDNKDSTDPNIQNLMKGLNLSDDQLNEFSKLQNEVAQDYLNGDKSTEENRMELKAEIDSKISARMRVIFPGLNNPNDRPFDPRDPNPPALTSDKQRIADNMKAAMFVMLADNTNRNTKHRRRNTEFSKVKEEFIRTEERLEKFYNPEEMERKGIQIPFSEEAKKPKLSTRATAKRDNILATHYGTNASNASKSQMKMAESLAIMHEFKELSDGAVAPADTQVYTAKQYMDAAQYVAAHENDSRESRNAVRANFSVTGKEMVSVVAEQVTKTYTDVSGESSGDHRRAIARGAEAEIPKPLTGTAIEKEVATRKTREAYEQARDIVKAEDEEYGTRMYYDSSMNRFQAKDVINREHHPGYDLDTYAGYIARKREEENEREAIEIEDFAREMLDDLPKYANEPTYDGLTQREYEEYAENLRDKFAEELTRTGVTTVGATLAAPIGAGLAIGLSDDESAITEGLMGAAAGIVVGDNIAESAMGRELDRGGKSKKVKILNPYTNEIEDFELKKDGITADATLIALINNGEVLRYDDPRLDQYSYNLNRQFIEHKVEKQRARENERRRELIDEALRNSRN